MCRALVMLLEVRMDRLIPHMHNIIEVWYFSFVGVLIFFPSSFPFFTIDSLFLIIDPENLTYVASSVKIEMLYYSFPRYIHVQRGNGGGHCMQGDGKDRELVGQMATFSLGIECSVATNWPWKSFIFSRQHLEEKMSGLTVNRPHSSIVCQILTRVNVVS